MISEGGIDNSIDKLVYEYDQLKTKYDMDWSSAILHGNGKIGKVATMSAIEEFINKCEDLHSRVISIQDQATQHVEKMLKEVGLRVAQAVIFKIQELSFSLKKVVGEAMPKEIDKELTSPERRARLKSANSEIKSKSMIEKEDAKATNPSLHEKVDRNANKSQSKSVIAKKKNNYSQIDKEELPHDDFSLLEPGKSDIRNVK